MSYNSRIKLEPRGDKDPKFDPNNKVDRKIMKWVIISSVILLLIIAALFTIYYLFFYVKV